MLLLAAAFTRQKTGWLRQNASLAERLIPIDGLISASDVAAVKEDWDERRSGGREGRLGG